MCKIYVLVIVDTNTAYKTLFEKEGFEIYCSVLSTYKWGYMIYLQVVVLKIYIKKHSATDFLSY